jgi:hypothetical protein
LGYYVIRKRSAEEGFYWPCGQERSWWKVHSARYVDTRVRFNDCWVKMGLDGSLGGKGAEPGFI